MTEHYHQVYSRADIDRAVTRIASEITAEYDGHTPLLLAIGEGSQPFRGWLIDEIAHQAPHFQFDFDTFTTIRPDLDSASDRLVVDQNIRQERQIAGRTVIGLENLLDMGRSASFARTLLSQLGAKTFKLAALFEKQSLHGGITADYVGLQLPDDFYFGAGMRVTGEAPRAFMLSKGVWRASGYGDEASQFAYTKN